MPLPEMTRTARPPVPATCTMDPHPLPPIRIYTRPTILKSTLGNRHNHIMFRKFIGLQVAFKAQEGISPTCRLHTMLRMLRSSRAMVFQLRTPIRVYTGWVCPIRVQITTRHYLLYHRRLHTVKLYLNLPHLVSHINRRWTPIDIPNFLLYRYPLQLPSGVRYIHLQLHPHHHLHPAKMSFPPMSPVFHRCGHTHTTVLDLPLHLPNLIFKGCLHYHIIGAEQITPPLTIFQVNPLRHVPLLCHCHQHPVHHHPSTRHNGQVR